MRSSLLICLFFLVGCAAKGYQNALERWIGKDAKVLVQNWGQPQTSRKLKDGSIAYEFHREKVVRTSLATTNGYCKTTFIADSKDRIVSYYFEGNTCGEHAISEAP